MDNSNYNLIVAQFKKSSPLQHHFYPSYNFLSIDTLLRLSAEKNFPGSLPCYFPFEYEVKSSSVFLPGHNTVDEAANLVKKKLRWEKNCSSIELCDLNSVIDSVKNISRNKPAKLTARVRKYLEHFSRDPEPYFNGSYNWLYTGGSITSVGENEKLALVCVDYSGKKPGFSILKLNESLDRVEYNSFHQLKNFSPILQITCKTMRGSDEFVVCVRQKNEVSVFRVEETDVLTQPTKLWRKKVIYDKLLTSAGISDKCDLVAITDINYDVHVIDVESGSKTFGYVGRHLAPEVAVSHWGHVSFGDFGLCVAFRSRLHAFDIRDADQRPKWSFDPSPSTNDCEGITCVTNCFDSNYLYLATNHHLLQLDLRNQKPVQKWTHLMSNPPQFVSSVQSGEEELLVLQSWKMDEVVGVTNERVADECFLSKSLPCLLRTLKESLRMSRCQGTCLSPKLANRLDFAITGLTCIKDNAGEIFMFVQNSGGDIFLNKISKKKENGYVDAEEEKRSIESMQALESHLEKLRETSGNEVFKTVDMSHVLEELESNDEEEEKPWRKPDVHWKYHEMYAPESLSLCQDVLAQSFLQVWNTNTEEMDDRNEITNDEKVLDWISRM